MAADGQLLNTAAGAATQSKGATLFRLPDEIVQRVLQFLSAEDLAAFQACNRHCSRLTQLNLLWKPLCINSFRYWIPCYSRERLLATPAVDRNWKELMILRRTINNEVRQTLDDIVSNASGRIANISKIVKHREHAKELLRSYMALPTDRDDGLARMHWARETLASIDRALALEVWDKLRRHEHVPLEHAFGAFDLMIAHPAPLSLEEISSRLDMIANEFKISHPSYKEQSSRQRALTLAEWLQRRELTGLVSKGEQKEFSRVKNSLISIALCHEDHLSLPILSVVIYTCIAQRLGLDAHPVAYPVHVLATVIAPPDKDLDGSPLSSSSWATSSAPGEEELSASSVMYLDPFNGGQEISIGRLKDQLRLWGIPNHASKAVLSPASTIDLVRRVAANLRACLREWVNFEDLYLESDSPDEKDVHQTTLVPQFASYAAAWADFMFPTNQSTQPGFRHQPLGQLLRDFEAFGKQDTALLQKHVIPLLAEGPEREYLSYYVWQILRDDSEPVTVCRRDGVAKDKVKYRIGQLFRHVRYGYTAVIYGWDTRCQADAHWINRMGVDSLADGREQCFYRVLDDTGNPRYVAEENIEILSSQDLLDGPPEFFMRVGGKWFKRYDRQRSQFVNNMLEQFPDDD